MRQFPILACLALAACGPAVSSDGDDTTGDDDPTAPDAGPQDCRDNAEICDNLTDDDCDGFLDCDDVTCFGVGSCGTPNDNCGEADVVEGQPLALPDGGGEYYASTIAINGFTDGQILEDPAGFLGICVNMEHSWIRDLQMEMTCPNGTVIILNMFLGTTGGEVYLGVPNDSDGTDPVPGVGYDYCWRPSATNAPMLDYANQTGVHDLPAGDYQASSGWTGLVGCPLNGDWSIRVQDLWGIDNGFIFSWGLEFDPALVEDCDNWDPE